MRVRENGPKLRWHVWGLLLLGILAMAAYTGCEKTGGEGEESVPTAKLIPPPPAPPDYADKHMPEGWWSDPDIIEQGRQLYIGVENIDVNCAACHGKDGKPVKKGARDFRQAERMKMYSDSQWFWRISEGVKGTKMPAWKKKLPNEEDRWKLIAYERTFGLDGLGWDVARAEWVPLAELGKPVEAANETLSGPDADTEHDMTGQDHQRDESSNTHEAGDDQGH